MRTYTGPLAVMALVTLIVACDDPKTRIPTAPGLPSIVNIEISGPDTLAPGQVAQYAAVARMTDGNRKNVLNARWFANTFFVRFDTTGMATAQSRVGETSVTVEVVGLPGGIRRATKEIVFVPTGTFRLAGSVTDGEFATTPVVGARVQVSPTIFVNTDFSGQYRLYGVPPQADLQITKDGYVPFSQAIELGSHTTRNVALTPNGPRLSLNGNYTLTIDAAPGCSGLSTDLQHRSYDATVTQNGLTITVTLTEPRFRTNGTGKGNRFSGTASTNSATFTLDSYFFYYYYYYGPPSYPSIAERLPDGSHLVIDGFAGLSGNSGGLTGTLNGGFSRWDSRFPSFGNYMGGCASSSNQFALTPR